MAYKDKEKQRECQRKWAAKKNAAIREEKAKEPALTVGDVLAIDVAKLQKYEGCIKEARQFYLGSHNTMERLKIAAIAEKACQIEHGGHRRGLAWEVWGRRDTLTLRRFAEAIGCHHKTLHEWVTTYRFFITLPKDTVADYRAVRMVIEMRPRPEDSVAAYLAMLDRGSREWREWTIMRVLRSAKAACDKHQVNSLDEEHRQEALHIMANLNAHFIPLQRVIARKAKVA